MKRILVDPPEWMRLAVSEQVISESKVAEIHRIFRGGWKSVPQSRLLGTDGGRPAMTCPSPAYQVFSACATMCPAASAWNRLASCFHGRDGATLTSHFVAIGDFAGPYPFSDDDGRLID